MLFSVRAFLLADTTDQPIHLFFEEPTLTSAPERIPVLPTPGTYPHPTYGPLDFGADTIAQFVSNFANGVYGQTLPIDVEHDHLSGAAGYIKQLHTNENGSVDADVTWTPMGKQLLAEDRFRYISPSILTSWTSPATRTTHKNVLTGAALTTRPYFKTASLRPLITASEPVVTSTVEGITMSEKTETQLAAEAEGSKIVEQSFGAQLAEAHAANAALKTQVQTFSEQLTAAQTEIRELKDAAQDRQFREQLAGVTDLDARIAELKALPVELHEGYIKRAQGEVAARRQFAERGPVGSPVAGDGTSALDKLNAKAAEIRVANPSMTEFQAFGEAAAQNKDLYSEYRREQRA